MTEFTVKAQFPDWQPPADMPDLPAGWRDLSWNGNPCPSWEMVYHSESSGRLYFLRLQVDYPDSDGPQYRVQVLDDNGAFIRDLAQADTWEDLRTNLPAYYRRWFPAAR